MNGSPLNKKSLNPKGKIAVALDSQKRGTCWVCRGPIKGQDRIRDQSPITRRVLEIKYANPELSITGNIPSNFLLAGTQINLDCKIRWSWGIMLNSDATYESTDDVVDVHSELVLHNREPLSVYSNLKSKTSAIPACNWPGIPLVSLEALDSRTSTSRIFVSLEHRWHCRHRHRQCSEQRRGSLSGES